MIRPQAHPALLAELAAQTPPRLVKKLDAEPSVALTWRWHADGRVETANGEVVQLVATDGVLRRLDDLICSCLLAPRCFHRLAVLSVLEPDREVESSGAAEVVSPHEGAVAAALSPSQQAAGALLWQVATSFLQAGGQSCGVVGQGQLLRAAFACREAGLHRAQAAAIRVGQGARALRAGEPSFSLEVWTESVAELIQVAYQLHHLQRCDPLWVGTTRRRYEPVGNLKLWGLFSEPILTATGYAGVVTWLADSRGQVYQLSDVAPGDCERVLQAYRAGTPLPGLSAPHAEIARARLLVQNATASPEGRLGSGQKVKGAVSGPSLWDDEELSLLWKSGTATASDLLFFQGQVLGAEREALVVQVQGVPVRLLPPSQDPLPGHDNLGLLARLPGRTFRWIVRLDPYRARTATALAVQAEGLESWGGRCNLGCERMHPSHFTGLSARAPALELPDDPQPFQELLRGTQRVALAGRGAARESSVLTRSCHSRGQKNAACLWRALVAAAERGERDLLGHWQPTQADDFCRRWLALSVYLSAATSHWSRANWGQIERAKDLG